eukprot:TRINITY_DN2110_c0_g1_i3.p1 TRINITY_DN2110_c0_g1~~TRINITY_DN2110_c0_g1_i3.p1  ORF type:complete len:185 (-),score=41.79 TRINITY_DN2110_c0_g1_i3:568-1122(-)
MSTAIKYFAIIRVIDHLPLYTYGFDPAIADECKKSALDLSRRLTPAELQNDVRRGEKHTYGKWCSTVDKHRIIYAMLVDSSYRDRHAYWAIKEFQQILFKNPEYHLMSDADAGKLLHAEGEKILQKYNDPNNWDKLTEPKEEMCNASPTLLNQNFHNQRFDRDCTREQGLPSRSKLTIPFQMVD